MGEHEERSEEQKNTFDDLLEQQKNTFDDLLEHLGTGKWSLLYFVIASVYNGCFAMQALSGGFIAPLMNHTCLPPAIGYSTTNSTVQNLSSSTYQYSLPTSNRSTITVLDQCSYKVTTADGVSRNESCKQWDFDHTYFGDTLTSQMSLVCERSYFVPLYQSLYMLGGAVGSSAGGLLSDKLGRYKVFTMSALALMAVGSGITLFSNIYFILAARAALGFLHNASMESSYVLVMETTTSRARPVAGMMIMVPWALGIVAFGGLGYAIRNWRYLQLAITLPFTLLIPFLWLIDESPRWLLVRGELEKAQRIVHKAAKWQKVEPPSPNSLRLIMNDLQKQKEDTDKKPMSVWNWICQRLLDLVVLFRKKQLCLMTVVVCSNFFASSLIYFGLSLSAVNFSTDPYIYMALGGLVEVPSYTLTGPIFLKVGRKPPAIFFFLVTGMTLIALPFIPPGMEWARITLAMMGKLCISAVFVEFFLYASEVFPTEVRLQGLGTGLLFSRLGSITSPFINDFLAPVHPLMTSLVFGGLSVTTAIATFILPETKDEKMPDVVDDIEKKSVTLAYTGKAREKPVPEDLSILT